MRQNSRWLVASASLCCAVLAGCDRGTYFAETVVHSDGSARRTIFQPFEGTPTAVRDPKLWDQVSYSTSPDDLVRWGWPNPIAYLPRRKHPAQPQYFVAGKEFPTVDQILDHLVILGREEIKASGARLIRDYARTDYGFLVEHRWKETLTDCVTLEDRRKARAELVDLAIDIVSEAYNEVYGREYDATGLFKWLRTEGKAWLFAMTEALFDPAIARDESRLKETLAAICGQHGLTLIEDGKLLESEKMKHVIDAFQRDLLLRHIRRKDGNPLNQEYVNRLVGEFLNFDPNSRVTKAYNDVITRKYGDRKAFDQRVGELVFRFIGLYFPFGSLIHFDNIVSLPGEIMETNGGMLSRNRVRWRFDASKAFPSGYAMECRSLESNPAMLRLLPAGNGLGDRKGMIEFVRLVSEHELLHKALQECAKAKSLKPLSTYRNAIVAKPGTAAEAAALEKLETVLNFKME